MVNPENLITKRNRTVLHRFVCLCFLIEKHSKPNNNDTCSHFSFKMSILRFYIKTDNGYITWFHTCFVLILAQTLGFFLVKNSGVFYVYASIHTAGLLVIFFTNKENRSGDPGK